MQDVLNPLDLSLYIADLEKSLSEKGVTVEYRTDFGYLVRLCEELPTKGYPTAMFNPLHNYIGPANGFWIRGTNSDDEVVAMQAIRFDQLNGTNLHNEIESLRAFYSDPSESAPDGEWCKSFAPIANEISGPTAYHGELWLDDKLRGLDLAQTWSRLAMALTEQRFSPDWLWAITYEPIVMKGIATKFGYWHLQPEGVVWERPYRSERLVAWIMWLGGKDINNLIMSDLIKSGKITPPQNARPTPTPSSKPKWVLSH